MPTSHDPDKRARQLANLRPNPVGAGNALARSHGGYAAIARDRLEGKALEVFDALAADAPLRDSADNLPGADHAQVHLLADVLCRLEDVSANVRDFGLFEQRGKCKGQVRPAVELEARMRREASDYLDALGMTPRSRAKLGVDTVRGLSLADEIAAAQTARSSVAGAEEDAS